MTTYQVRPAKRSEAKPLIGLYSESGAGKTYSALLLARGFVGPSGKIIMIETESGRGESYADPREYPEIGGYDVVSMREDFSPKEYGEALTAVEKARPDAVLIDSASHEWEGAGGVLDMAARNQAAGRKGPLVWQQPKIDHQRHFMLRFMQTPIPLVILNMRAKYPMEEIIRDGKKEWARSKDLDPKQSEDILFEMFVHGWIEKDSHNFHRTKCTSKSLIPIFEDGKPISIETGRKLAEWAHGVMPATKPVDPKVKEAGDKAAKDGVEAYKAWLAALAPDVKETVRQYHAAWSDEAKKSDAAPKDATVSDKCARCGGRGVIETADGKEPCDCSSVLMAG